MTQEVYAERGSIMSNEATLISKTPTPPSLVMTIEEITAKLADLQDDPTMNTKSVYSPMATDYPDSRFPFVEVHLAYLRKNKMVNARQYISNLEIMIKRR